MLLILHHIKIIYAKFSPCELAYMKEEFENQAILLLLYY